MLVNHARASVVSDCPRRHLTASQRATVAVDVESYLAQAAKANVGHNQHTSSSEKIQKSKEVHAAKQAAQMLGTNEHYVIDAKKLKEKAPRAKPGNCPACEARASCAAAGCIIAMQARGGRMVVMMIDGVEYTYTPGKQPRPDLAINFMAFVWAELDRIEREKRTAKEEQAAAGNEPKEDKPKPDGDASA